MYLLGAALGALAAMFLMSRLLRWALGRAGFGGRGAIVLAHAGSLATALAAAGIGIAQGEGALMAPAVVLYSVATAVCLGLDLVTFKISWWRRPVYQVI